MKNEPLLETLQTLVKTFKNNHEKESNEKRRIKNQQAIDYLTSLFTKAATKGQDYWVLKIIPQNGQKDVYHFQIDVEETLFIDVEATIQYFKEQGFSPLLDDDELTIMFSWA